MAETGFFLTLHCLGRDEKVGISQFSFCLSTTLPEYVRPNRPLLLRTPDASHSRDARQLEEISSRRNPPTRRFHASLSIFPGAVCLHFREAVFQAQVVFDVFLRSGAGVVHPVCNTLTTRGSRTCRCNPPSMKITGSRDIRFSFPPVHGAPSYVFSADHRKKKIKNLGSKT